jgi:hypothetical protein
MWVHESHTFVNGDAGSFAPNGLAGLRLSVSVCRLHGVLLHRVLGTVVHCELPITEGKKRSPTTHHGGAWGERRYSSYSFSTSALDGGEWSASRLGRAFTPGERTPGAHCTGGWVGLRAGLDTEAKGKILSLPPGIEPWSPGWTVGTAAVIYKAISHPGSPISLTEDQYKNIIYIFFFGLERLLTFPMPFFLWGGGL